MLKVQMLVSAPALATGCSTKNIVWIAVSFGHVPFDAIAVMLYSPKRLVFTEVVKVLLSEKLMFWLLASHLILPLFNWAVNSTCFPQVLWLLPNTSWGCSKVVMFIVAESIGQWTLFFK